MAQVQEISKLSRVGFEAIIQIGSGGPRLGKGLDSLLSGNVRIELVAEHPAADGETHLYKVIAWDTSFEVLEEELKEVLTRKSSDELAGWIHDRTDS